MKTLDVQKIKTLVRDVPDFPKKGILFKDITPVLASGDALRECIDVFVEELQKQSIDCVVGIESRGFIFSPVIAYKLGVGFVPVRKKGKLPYHTEEVAYDLEYGQAVIQIHKDAIRKGARVAIVDDLLATGGTAQAAVQLVEKLGGKVVKIAFLIELLFLEGRKKLSGYDTFSIIQY